MNLVHKHTNHVPRQLQSFPKQALRTFLCIVVEGALSEELVHEGLSLVRKALGRASPLLDMTLVTRTLAHAPDQDEHESLQAALSDAGVVSIIGSPVSAQQYDALLTQVFALRAHQVLTFYCHGFPGAELAGTYPAFSQQCYAYLAASDIAMALRRETCPTKARNVELTSSRPACLEFTLLAAIMQQCASHGLELTWSTRSDEVPPEQTIATIDGSGRIHSPWIQPSHQSGTQTSAYKAQLLVAVLSQMPDELEMPRIIATSGGSGATSHSSTRRLLSPGDITTNTCPMTLLRGVMRFVPLAPRRSMFSSGTLLTLTLVRTGNYFDAGVASEAPLRPSIRANGLYSYLTTNPYPNTIEHAFKVAIDSFNSYDYQKLQNFTNQAFEQMPLRKQHHLSASTFNTTDYLDSTALTQTGQEVTQWYRSLVANGIWPFTAAGIAMGLVEAMQSYPIWASRSSGAAPTPVPVAQMPSLAARFLWAYLNLSLCVMSGSIGVVQCLTALAIIRRATKEELPDFTAQAFFQSEAVSDNCSFTAYVADNIYFCLVPSRWMINQLQAADRAVRLPPTAYSAGSPPERKAAWLATVEITKVLPRELGSALGAKPPDTYTPSGLPEPQAVGASLSSTVPTFFPPRQKGANKPLLKQQATSSTQRLKVRHSMVTTSVHHDTVDQVPQALHPKPPATAADILNSPIWSGGGAPAALSLPAPPRLPGAQALPTLTRSSSTNAHQSNAIGPGPQLGLMSILDTDHFDTQYALWKDELRRRLVDSGAGVFPNDDGDNGDDSTQFSTATNAPTTTQVPEAAGSSSMHAAMGAAETQLNMGINPTQNQNFLDAIQAATDGDTAADILDAFEAQTQPLEGSTVQAEAGLGLDGAYTQPDIYAFLFEGAGAADAGDDVILEILTHVANGAAFGAMTAPGITPVDVMAYILNFNPWWLPWQFRWPQLAFAEEGASPLQAEPCQTFVNRLPREVFFLSGDLMNPDSTNPLPQWWTQPRATQNQGVTLSSVRTNQIALVRFLDWFLATNDIVPAVDQPAAPVTGPAPPPTPAQNETTVQRLLPAVYALGRKWLATCEQIRALQAKLAVSLQGSGYLNNLELTNPHQLSQLYNIWVAQGYVQVLYAIFLVNEERQQAMDFFTALMQNQVMVVNIMVADFMRLFFDTQAPNQVRNPDPAQETRPTMAQTHLNETIDPAQINLLQEEINELQACLQPVPVDATWLYSAQFAAQARRANMNRLVLLIMRIMNITPVYCEAGAMVAGFPSPVKWGLLANMLVQLDPNERPYLYGYQLPQFNGPNLVVPDFPPATLPDSTTPNPQGAAALNAAVAPSNPNAPQHQGLQPATPGGNPSVNSLLPPAPHGTSAVPYAPTVNPTTVGLTPDDTPGAEGLPSEAASQQSSGRLGRLLQFFCFFMLTTRRHSGGPRNPPRRLSEFAESQTTQLEDANFLSIVGELQTFAASADARPLGRQCMLGLLKAQMAPTLHPARPQSCMYLYGTRFGCPTAASAASALPTLRHYTAHAYAGTGLVCDYVQPGQVAMTTLCWLLTLSWQLEFNDQASIHALNNLINTLPFNGQYTYKGPIVAIVLMGSSMNDRVQWDHNHKNNLGNNPACAIFSLEQPGIQSRFALAAQQQRHMELSQYISPHTNPSTGEINTSTLYERPRWVHVNSTSGHKTKCAFVSDTITSGSRVYATLLNPAALQIVDPVKEAFAARQTNGLRPFVNVPRTWDSLTATIRRGKLAAASSSNSKPTASMETLRFVMRPRQHALGLPRTLSPVQRVAPLAMLSDNDVMPSFNFLSAPLPFERNGSALSAPTRQQMDAPLLLGSSSGQPIVPSLLDAIDDVAQDAPGNFLPTSSTTSTAADLQNALLATDVPLRLNLESWSSQDEENELSLIFDKHTWTRGISSTHLSDELNTIDTGLKKNGTHMPAIFMCILQWSQPSSGATQSAPVVEKITYYKIKQHPVPTVQLQTFQRERLQFIVPNDNIQSQEQRSSIKTDTSTWRSTSASQPLLPNDRSGDGWHQTTFFARPYLARATKYRFLVSRRLRRLLQPHLTSLPTTYSTDAAAAPDTSAFGGDTRQARQVFKDLLRGPLRNDASYAEHLGHAVAQVDLTTHPSYQSPFP